MDTKTKIFRKNRAGLNIHVAFQTDFELHLGGLSASLRSLKQMYLSNNAQRSGLLPGNILRKSATDIRNNTYAPTMFGEATTFHLDCSCCRQHLRADNLELRG